MVRKSKCEYKRSPNEEALPNVVVFAGADSPDRPLPTINCPPLSKIPRSASHSVIHCMPHTTRFAEEAEAAGTNVIIKPPDQLQLKARCLGATAALRKLGGG